MPTALNPEPATSRCRGAMLDGRRILVTGVLNRHSIAFATASRAQELGAEVILTGFGRTKRMTERSAEQLPGTAEVLELDVNSPEDVERVRAELDARWGVPRRTAARRRLRPAGCARRRVPRHLGAERRGRLPDERVLAQGARGWAAAAAHRGAGRRERRRAGLRRRRGVAVV